MKNVVAPEKKLSQLLFSLHAKEFERLLLEWINLKSESNKNKLNENNKELIRTVVLALARIENKQDDVKSNYSNFLSLWGMLHESGFPLLDLSQTARFEMNTLFYAIDYQAPHLVRWQLKHAPQKMGESLFKYHLNQRLLLSLSLYRCSEVFLPLLKAGADPNACIECFGGQYDYPLAATALEYILTQNVDDYFLTQLIEAKGLENLIPPRSSLMLEDKWEAQKAQYLKEKMASHLPISKTKSLKQRL